MEQLFFSLNATIPVFLVMVIGYILKQLRMIDEPFVKTLNSFNYKITLPVLLFRDIAGSDFYSVWDTKYVLYCFWVTLICISALWIFAGLFYKNKSQLGELIQASYRSSAAVLILSFTGPNTHDIDKASLKASVKGIITNPIIIGILLGMLASLCRISFPVIISKTLNNIAVLASPLALIGLGAGFEGRKAIKQLVPTTASCYIMAKSMGHEGTLTSSVVMATTFLSSVTLTMYLFILRSLSLI